MQSDGKSFQITKPGAVSCNVGTIFGKICLPFSRQLVIWLQFEAGVFLPLMHDPASLKTY